MLQIRLSKPPSEGGGAKPVPVDSVTVACPDHLVLADLLVAKGLGSPTGSAPLKIVGRRSRRQLGERVHFCVHCDLPIAVYGRLSPCEHVFCLDCARSDSLCFLCEERIQKIQTIKMMEGLFICAAPHCLKSFLKKSDFESHINEAHLDLLRPNAEKDGIDSEAVSARKLTASESTVQGPPRTLSVGSNLQVHDREAHRVQPRDQLPPRTFMQPKPMPGFPGQIPNQFPEQQLDNNPPPGFDRLGPPNRYAQQSFDPQGEIRQDLGKVADKQIGMTPESPFPEYPMQVHQPTNFPVAVIRNQVLAAPQFGYPPLVPDGVQQFYGTPFEMGRPESNQEQGSLLGFPPGPAAVVSFAEGYPRPWSMGPAVGTFEPHSSQGTGDGFTNASDLQGRAGMFQAGILAPPLNKGTESVQGGMSVDPQGGKGILAPQPVPLLPLPPPPPFPPHLSHLKQGKSYYSEVNNDGQYFDRPSERRGGFGSSQD